MADMDTMVRAIADEVGVHIAGSADPTENAIRKAIRRAIRSLRHRPFAWNRADLAITPLVVDQIEYPKGATASDLPNDFLFLHSQTMWCEDTSASDYDVWEMTPITYREIENEKKLGGTASGDSGQPTQFCFTADSGDDELWIYPAPDATTYKLFGSYIKDLGEPTYTISGGTYTWTANDSGNPWYDQGAGYELVFLNACATFWGGWGKNAQRAGEFLALAQAELTMDVVQEEKVRSPRSVRGYF